jgi:hypothetical protein
MALVQTALPVSTRAWEKANSRFLEGLSESERSMFGSATMENLFYQSSGTFERYKVDSKLWKFQVKIQPLLDAVEEYGSAMDVYANASSMILCPIWGSLRVVIHVSADARAGYTLPNFCSAGPWLREILRQAHRHV